MLIPRLVTGLILRLIPSQICYQSRKTKRFLSLLFLPTSLHPCLPPSLLCPPSPCLPSKVESKRIDLLKHPLVTSLLNYKWRTFARYVYFGNLLIYLIFLIFLTCFALLVINPLTQTCECFHNVLTWNGCGTNLHNIGMRRAL